MNAPSQGIEAAAIHASTSVGSTSAARRYRCSPHFAGVRNRFPRDAVLPAIVQRQVVVALLVPPAFYQAFIDNWKDGTLP